MVSPEIKRGTDLTKQELLEINQMVRQLHHELPENHIEVNHVAKTNPLFYLYKVEGQIVACQAYTLRKLDTPFARHPLPVIFINISYKYDWANAHVKNFAKRSNLSFIRSNIGRLWYFKKFVLTFETVNPRLVERVSATFDKFYPHYEESVPDQVINFANYFCTEQLGSEAFHLNESLISNSYKVRNPVTDEDWEKMYQSSNPRRDQFFKELGIYFDEPGQRVLTGSQLFFVGVYSLGGIISKKWKGLVG